MLSTSVDWRMFWELHEAVRALCVWGVGALVVFSLALYVILITKEQAGGAPRF